MTDPLQPSFWWNEEQELWNSFARPTLAVIFAGAKAGVQVLPAKLQVLADWDLVNSRALDFLDQYRLNIVDGIGRTTRTQAVKAIEAWVKSGEPLPVLEERLAPIFGDARAQAIATTEVTRIYQAGNELSWDATGFVDQETFHTSNDERVCEICFPMDGAVIDLGNADQTPPLHVRCRCWTTPVVNVEKVGAKVAAILGPSPFAAEPVDALIDRWWERYGRKGRRRD